MSGNSKQYADLSEQFQRRKEKNQGVVHWHVAKGQRRTEQHTNKKIQAGILIGNGHCKTTLQFCGE